MNPVLVDLEGRILKFSDGSEHRIPSEVDCARVRLMGKQAAVMVLCGEVDGRLWRKGFKAVFGYCPKDKVLEKIPTRQQLRDLAETGNL